MGTARDVLIIDDEQVIADSAALILRGQGYTVDSALDVPSAEAKLSAATYRVMLVDLMLPHSSGLQFLQSTLVRQNAILGIAMSGYATFGNAVEAFKKGAFDFIPKPFDCAELLGVVSRALRLSRLREENQGLEGPGVRVPATAGTQLYSLGGHSWARVRDDGDAEMGVGAAFSQTIGAINKISFPDMASVLNQGGTAVQIFDADESVHTVWAPLSGVVTACNREAEQSGLLNKALEPQWLVRFKAADLHGELANLKLLSTL